MPSVYPAIKVKLHTYFTVALSHINDQAVRLQISPDDVTKLNALFGDETTADTYENLFSLWSAKGISRTSLVVGKLLKIENEMKNLLSDIYDNIPSRLWTNDDRLTFNRKNGLKISRPRNTKQIVEKCPASTKLLGGGMLKIICRTLHDGGRASLPQGSSGVEIAYRVAPMFIETSGGKKERNSIHSPEECKTRVFSSKARFTMELGLENAGLELQFFVHWINIRHPNLAGPWTGPFYSLIV